jgi:hypothetical protein
MSLRNGGAGVPTRRDIDPPNAPPKDIEIPVNNLGINPTGNNGRIVLAVPAATGNPLEDAIYQGWLYVAVVTGGDHLQGLYLTKDFGLNWTKLRITDRVNGATHTPTNDDSIATDYDVLGNATFAQGNYDISIAVDPNNPNIVYLGGTADGNPYGFIRVDATTVQDPYALVAYDNSNNDGGAVQFSTLGGIAVKNGGGAFGLKSHKGPILNLLRDPDNPFLSNASLQFNNVASFTNNGQNTRWMGFANGLSGTDQHELIVFRDPLTGFTRLIYGDDQAVATGIDVGDGSSISGFGSALSVAGSRVGNLQITQFYYGAAQPSTLAAAIAGAMFYGNANSNGFPISTADLLQTGELNWDGS